MKSYLDELKEMYLNSEKIAILFKDKQLIWTNKTKNFFNGKLPAYSEILIDNPDNPCKLPDCTFYLISFKIENNIFKGTMVENIKDDSLYNTVIIEVNSDFLQNNINADSPKNILIELTNEIHQKISNEITTLNACYEVLEDAYREELEEKFSKNNEMKIKNIEQLMTIIDEHLYGIMYFLNSLLMLANIFQDSEEYKNKKNNSVLDYISEIKSRVNNVFDFNIECDFKTNDLDKPFVFCNKKALIRVILYGLRYVLLLSKSNNIRFVYNKINEKICEIIISTDKNNSDSDFVNSNYMIICKKRLEKIAVEYLCKCIEIDCREEENNETFSLILNFNISCNINKFESKSTFEEFTGKFSILNTMLYDFLKTHKGDIN